MNFPRESFSESLQRLVDAEIGSQIMQREGSLTTRINGSHIDVTARLRSRWARLAAYVPDPDRLDAICVWLEAAAKGFDCALKSAALLGAAYILYSVASALAAHGVVARLIGGF
jgi:hypothetical protein